MLAAFLADLNRQRVSSQLQADTLGADVYEPWSLPPQPSVLHNRRFPTFSSVSQNPGRPFLIFCRLLFNNSTVSNNVLQYR